ncbi:MAG: hypothetical protein RLZZ618_1210 [Pseudomonadota bacterium]|jgi:uncharacterized MAPEG superfamily protein
MTFAYWCVLVVALLPIACAGFAKGGAKGAPKQGGYDNNNPREWLARQEGVRARANAAQANGFEALPFFIGGVLIAHQVHAPQLRIDVLAAAFVVCRLIYIGLYLSGRGNLRSLVWTTGLLINVALFFVGL